MNEKNIKKEVLEKIESGKISMKPRFFFVFKLVSLMVVSIFVFLISSFLVGFIGFSLIASGKLFLLGFGLRGLLIFFLIFPWTLLMVEIVLILLMEWLIKQFKFGYRSSLSMLVLMIIVVSIGISVIINSTPVHEFLLKRAERRDLPTFFGDYYGNIRKPAPGQDIFRGVVSDVGTSSFVLNQAEDISKGIYNQKYFVVLPSNFSEQVPEFGDTVFVAGRLFPENMIEAFGLQIFNSSDID